MIPYKGQIEACYNDNVYTVRCDSSTFLRITGRVRWIKPRTITEWAIGRRITFWKCVKCGEEFISKPNNQCNTDTTTDRHHNQFEAVYDRAKNSF